MDILTEEIFFVNLGLLIWNSFNGQLVQSVKRRGDEGYCNLAFCENHFIRVKNLVQHPSYNITIEIRHNQRWIGHWSVKQTCAHNSINTLPYSLAQTFWVLLLN